MKFGTVIVYIQKECITLIFFTFLKCYSTLRKEKYLLRKPIKDTNFKKFPLPLISPILLRFSKKISRFLYSFTLYPAYSRIGRGVGWRNSTLRFFICAFTVRRPSVRPYRHATTASY